MEVWKEIKGYDNSYMISSNGNVKSFKQNKNGKPLKKRCRDNKEYVSLRNNGRTYVCYIADLMRKYFPSVNYKDFKSQFK